MMDRERQEKDLQEVFETTQGAYRAAVENTFALQEQTLEFARNLLGAPAEALQDQAENNRATLEALAEQSRKQRLSRGAPRRLFTRRWAPGSLTSCP